MAGSTWGGGSCQVQIEQGPRALGEFPPIAAQSRKKERNQKEAGNQAKASKQASKHA